MKNKFEFTLENDESVILTRVILNGSKKFFAAVDTAATHSTFNKNALILAGVELGNSIEDRMIETSGGLLRVEIYELESIEAIGHRAGKFRLQLYDFLAHGIVPSYDGVLGLDFLTQKDLCIHFSKGYLTFH